MCIHTSALLWPRVEGLDVAAFQMLLLFKGRMNLKNGPPDIFKRRFLNFLDNISCTAVKEGERLGM